MLECKTCHGRYEPIQGDGTIYFHACPPVFDEATQKFVPRDNARDENIKAVTGADAGKIKAEGLGVLEVPR